MHVPPYLRGLNPEQQRAALATDGPVLVLAGAGSGKTRTLVHRIVHLIRGRGADPRSILAVTFTNKAAAEMRERVVKMAGREARGALLCTFHSLGARILRERGEAVGLPKDFTIYPSSDQLAVVKRIVAEEVHVQATAGDDAFDAKRVHFRISEWKNRLMDPAAAAREVAEGRTKGNRKDDYEVLAADVYPRYEQALRAAGACDFDDLLVLPVRLLQADADARAHFWKRWKWLMVDEYQDTNGAQLEMARLLAGPHRNVCVVGDDDQSIYAWRGADVRNILEFEKHFPGAEVVVLDRNYRSTQRILDAANGVIAHNPRFTDKRLRTDGALGPKVDYYEFAETHERSAEEQEAEMVAREIGLRRFAENLQWGDFAVLYRTNLQSRPLEEALRAVNVPYRVIGGQSFFDRKEIADLTAYLNVLRNPRDEVSLRRIVNYPTRGIGRTTLLRLVDAARAARRPLYEQLRHVADVPEVSRAQAEPVAHFVGMMDELRTELSAVEAALRTGLRDRTLVGLVREVVRRVRLEEAIRSDNAKSDRATEVRLDILRDFVATVGAYEDRVRASKPLPDEEDGWEPPSLSAFLERISLSQEDDDRREREEDEPNLVTLMTLHSAKGLEFTHVFLVGLEEDILPHARSVEMAGEAETDPIAEERRLMYVGITRARHRLTLSACATRRQRGEAVPRQPSRFLREIPTELVERRTGGTSSLSTEESQAFRANIQEQLRKMLAG